MLNENYRTKSWPDFQETAASPAKKQLDDKLTNIFVQIAGEDLEIDAFELQKVITVALKKGVVFAIWKNRRAENITSLVHKTASRKSGLSIYDWWTTKVIKKRLIPHRWSFYIENLPVSFLVVFKTVCLPRSGCPYDQKLLHKHRFSDVVFDEFTIDTCRSLIALVDLSRSGKLDVEGKRVSDFILLA